MEEQEIKGNKDNARDFLNRTLGDPAKERSVENSKEKLRACVREAEKLISRIKELEPEPEVESPTKKVLNELIVDWTLCLECLEER